MNSRLHYRSVTLIRILGVDWEAQYTAGCAGDPTMYQSWIVVIHRMQTPDGRVRSLYDEARWARAKRHIQDELAGAFGVAA